MPQMSTKKSTRAIAGWRAVFPAPLRGAMTSGVCGERCFVGCLEREVGWASAKSPVMGVKEWTIPRKTHDFAEFSGKRGMLLVRTQKPGAVMHRVCV